MSVLVWRGEKSFGARDAGFFFCFVFVCGKCVLVNLGVTVFLGETEINGVDCVCLAAKSNQKIVWFDVTMDETLGMDEFDSTDGRRRGKSGKLC